MCMEIKHEGLEYVGARSLKITKPYKLLSWTQWYQLKGYKFRLQKRQWTKVKQNKAKQEHGEPFASRRSLSLDFLSWLPLLLSIRGVRLSCSSTLVIASWSLESLDKIELWAKFRFLKRENWWLPIPVPNKAALLLRRERRPRRRNFFHRWILQSDGLGCSREILPNQLLLFTVQLLPALSSARINLLLLLVRIWANEYILSFPSLPVSRYFFAPADPSVKKEQQQQQSL